MVLYHNRVKNKFNPNTIKSTMTKKQNPTTNSSSTNETKFVQGSGVGSQTTSNRRALFRKAQSNDSCCN